MDPRLIPSGERTWIHLGADPLAVAELAARFVAERAVTALARHATFRIALAGGSTPRATYERLAAPDLSPRIDWARVSVFFGDERMVSPEDAFSNYRMAWEALLSRVPIPEENVHRIEGELGADVAARRYAEKVGRTPLDLVLLGMGEDGHVASLFPLAPELDSTDVALPSTAPVPPHERVTLGLGVLNGARAVGLMVTGATKAARLAQVFAEKKAERPTLPAARVQPETGELHWFLDDAAVRAEDLA
ncbi:MAG TPA: 6-phosphogluconolactonase [Polyangiaceae bacterium]